MLGLFETRSDFKIKKNGKYISIPKKYAIIEEDKNGNYKYSTDLKNGIDKNYSIKEFDNYKNYNEYLKMYKDIKKIIKLDTKFYNLKLNENIIKWKEETNPRIFFLDIETIDLENREFPEPIKSEVPITHIQILDSKTNKIFILMLRDVSEELKTKYPDVEFKVFDNEIRMLKYFQKMIVKSNVDIITAFNGDYFDFSYILVRSLKLGINIDNYSPLGSVKFGVKYETSEGKKRIYDLTIDDLEIVQNSNPKNIEWIYDVKGTYFIDFLTLYKKFYLKPLPSYSLEYITKLYLKEGDGKISYKNYNSIYDFFEKDYDGFTEYSIRDVEVLRDLNIKLKLFEILIGQMKLFKVPDLKMVISPIQSWYYKLSDVYFDLGIIPPADQTSSRENFEGGFVKDPIKGFQKNLFSIDYNSLYPSIISALNISFENTIKFNELLERNLISDEEYEFLLRCNSEDYILNDFENIMSKIKKISKRLNLVFGGFTFFKRDKKGIIAELVSEIYYTRKSEKGKYLSADIILENKSGIKLSQEELIEKIDNLEITVKNAKDYFCEGNTEKLKLFSNQKEIFQHILKIALNSLYGAITSPYFAFFDIDVGNAITYIGRILIKRTGYNFNEKNKELLRKKQKKEVDTLIYTDTDSCYITINPFVNFNVNSNESLKKLLDLTMKYIDKVGNPLLDKTIDKFIDDFNFYHKDFMGAKIEKIVLKGFWIAKKKYALLKFYDEGVVYEYEDIMNLFTDKGIAVTGLDIIQSSTPDFAKEKLTNLIKIILRKDENYLQKYFKEVKKEYDENKENMLERIARITNVKSVDCKVGNDGKLFRIKEDKKLGCPINSGGAFYHNKLIDKLKLNSFEKIKNGNKVKMLYLKKPNVINFHSIAFQDEKFLMETGLFKYIDFKTQFEKIIIQPINLILETINWNLEKKAVLF